MYNSQVLASVARLEVEESAECVDLIAGNNCGLLPLLDKVLVQERGTPKDYMVNVRRWHGHHPRLGLCPGRPLHFSVRHFGGVEVVYSAADFIKNSSEYLTADLVNLFHPKHCTSGFVSHLYAAETKQDSPSRFNLAQPTSGSQAQFVHQQVDSLLRRLLASTPSFLLCLRPCPPGPPGAPSCPPGAPAEWNSVHVTRQLRTFRVLETALVMSAGLVHRLRLAQFWGEFHSVAGKPLVGGMEGRCRAVLQVLRVASSEAQVSGRHVLFSESARKSLVAMKAARRAVGARRLQTWWRRLVAKNNLQSAASSLGLSLVSWKICVMFTQNIQFDERSLHSELSTPGAASKGVRGLRRQEDPKSPPLSLATPAHLSVIVPTQYLNTCRVNQRAEHLLGSTSYPPLNNPPNSTGVEEKLPGFPAALCLLWSST